MSVQYNGGNHWVHQECSVQYGYHEYTVGIPWWLWGVSWVHQGMFSTLGFPYTFNCVSSDLPPTFIMISAQCTDAFLKYAYAFPQCTEHPRVYSWYPLLYSWYLPGVLNIPVLLHIHYAGWLLLYYWLEYFLMLFESFKSKSWYRLKSFCPSFRLLTAMHLFSTNCNIWHLNLHYEVYFILNSIIIERTCSFFLLYHKFKVPACVSHKWMLTQHKFCIIDSV